MCVCLCVFVNVCVCVFVCVCVSCVALVCSCMYVCMYVCMYYVCVGPGCSKCMCGDQGTASGSVFPTCGSRGSNMGRSA